MVKGIVIWAVICTVTMSIAALLAYLKNRDYSFWMAWAFVFPPSILVLLLMPKHMGPRPQRPPADEYQYEDTSS